MPPLQHSINGKLAQDGKVYQASYKGRREWEKDFELVFWL